MSTYQLKMSYKSGSDTSTTTKTFDYLDGDTSVAGLRTFAQAIQTLTTQFVGTNLQKITIDDVGYAS